MSYNEELTHSVPEHSKFFNKSSFDCTWQQNRDVSSEFTHLQLFCNGQDSAGWL